MNKTRALIAIRHTGLALAIAALYGCGGSSSGDVASVSPSGGLHISTEGLAPPFDSPAAMCTATLVVAGTVDGFGSPHWNTFDGQKTSDASFQTVATKGYLIYTPVRLTLSVIAVDRRADKSGEFDVMGGQVGSDSYRAAAFDRPAAGGRYLMVLFPGIDGTNSAQTERSIVLYRAFPIVASNVQLRPKLVEQGQVSQQAVSVPLTSLLQQLANCK
jgi:hypothetical protein